MKKIKLLFILVIGFLLLGSGSPIYDYMLIKLPVDTVVYYHYWFDFVVGNKTEGELEPPRRNVPVEYQELFETTSAGIPQSVLESIAFVESGFIKLAKSPVREDGHRDLGMFQFNDKYHQWYSDTYNDGVLFDPFNPEEAIKIASLHIRFLYERYGNWTDVFIAYNAGMSRVDKDVIPESAWNYLEKIYKDNK